MRIHVRPQDGPELDVAVEAGLPAGRLRAHLALLTADPGWARGPLWVGRSALGDDHPAGAAPLVDGAQVAGGPVPPDDCVASVRAGAHLAVLSGPGAGGVLALPAGRTVVVPPSWTCGTPVMLRGRRIAGLRGSGLAVRRRARLRARRVRRWGPPLPWVALRAGDQVRGAGWRGELRHEPSAGRRRRRLPRTRVLALVAALVGPAALAIGTHQWTYLLLAVAGPAMLAGLPTPPADAEVPAAGPADVPALRMAAARARLGLAGPGPSEVPWGQDGTLLVSGPAAHDVASAIALLAAGSPPGTRLVVLTAAPARWRWVGWLDALTSLPTAQDRPTVVVADDPPDPAALAGWHAAGLGEHRLVVVAPDEDAGPVWATDRLVTDDGHCTRVGADGRRTSVDAPAVDASLVAQVARELASVGRSIDSAHPPDAVALGGLDGVPGPDPASVLATWDRAPAGLVLPLGRTSGGRPYLLDLVRDGPHVLIGGTTGSGKSQLLITLVLAAATRQPPDRLAMLLVDFKGGTGVGVAADLPHVLEHLSDLEPARADRTLTGLSAELRRRERVLAAAGVADLCDLDPDHPGTPPRLLVVVDEFRALLDDVPAAAGVLARLAAQGRALGVHLVLATQRPGGAVGPDLRANVSARIALRVADPQDSTDLLGSPDAVRIDRRTPGRALVRLGADPPVEVQLARAATQPPGCAVRPAPVWPTTRTWRPPARTADDAGAWVAAVLRAADGRPMPDVPWLPELGPVVRAEEVPAGPGLPIALVDRPELLAREALSWDPTAGHLLVVGASGSGRTTALLAAGAAALTAGYQVHAVGLPPAARTLLRRADLDGRLGTLCGHEDVLVVARLLELLDDGSSVRRLLLVDGLEQTVESLGRLARGTGADRLTRWWTSPGTAGAAPALAASAGAGPLVIRAAAAFADRLVLPLRDAGAAAMLGVPSTMVVDGPPGRGVHLSCAGPRTCQVVLGRDEPPQGRAREGTAARPSDRPARPARRRSAPGPVRLVPLPTTARAPLSDGAGHGPVLLGAGGDCADEVRLRLGPTFLVAGPPGSGRSAALRRLRRAAVEAGHRVLDASATAADLATVDGRPAVVVLDDLDELENADPATALRLEQHLLARRRGEATAWVLAATTLEHAATAFRGPTPLLVRARRLLVLDPAAPGGLDLLGAHGGWLADPGVRVPGRGVLRLGRDLTPVQVFEEEGIAFK